MPQIKKVRKQVIKYVLTNQEVYRVDELPKDVQDCVIERYTPIMDEIDWWTSILDELRERLEKVYVEYKDAEFDLDRNPYLKIEDVYLDIMPLYDLWVKDQGIYDEDIHKRIQEGEMYFDYDILTSRRSIGVGRSEFPIWMAKEQTPSDALRLYIYGGEGLDASLLDKFESEFCFWIMETITSILWDAYHQLESECEHIYSYEGIIDFLNANDYWFDKDGNEVDVVDDDVGQNVV